MTGESPAPAELAALVKQTFAQLEKQSYYQLLNVPPSADSGAIRAAFYRTAARLHPDRYHGVLEPATREQLVTIFARITEGYRVLMNPEQRAGYDRGLLEGKPRFDHRSARPEAQAPRNLEYNVKHPQARKFFKLGLMNLAGKNWKGAVMNLNFARGFEPDNQIIADKLADAQAAAKAHTTPDPAGQPPKK